MKRLWHATVPFLLIVFADGDVMRSVAQDRAGLAKQAPGFYRAKLGTFEVVVLSDGIASRNLEEILSQPGLVRDELTADHETEPIPLSINAFLINTGSHLVLIDTGSGKLFGPTSGLLMSNLAAAGYRADQVDTILLTHIHGDHSGGLSIGGIRQFPAATVYVGGREVARWLSKTEEQKAPPSARRTFEQSQATVNPYIKAGRLVEIKPHSEVVPGITAQRAPGHRAWSHCLPRGKPGPQVVAVGRRNPLRRSAVRASAGNGAI